MAHSPRTIARIHFHVADPPPGLYDQLLAVIKPFTPRIEPEDSTVGGPSGTAWTGVAEPVEVGRTGPRLLFPGLVPGKPIATHAMIQKLNRHGISVRAARNSALPALAADLPILADLAGMHRHTAIRWVTYARRDWAEYLAARTEEDSRKRR